MKKNSDESEENPGFFAVIPATVRYDKSLPQGAKLLYGEISALTKKKGYCWSRNPYFAELYDTSERTIIEWIWRLHAAGHIDIYFKYFPRSKKIARRYIALPYLSNKELPPELAEAHFVERKPLPPEGEGLVVKKSSPLIVKKTSPPEGLVVKKSSLPSGEENSLVIYTNSNNTSSSSDPPEIEKPPPGEEEKDAFDELHNYSENGFKIDPLQDVFQEKTFDTLSLKRLLRELNRSFVFSEPFYQKAIDFLEFNRLDLGYVSWLYEFCVKQKPASIANYFYKVFFDTRLAELFLEESRPPPVETFICPVCLTEHDSGLSVCPRCGLDSSCRHNQERIFKEKQFFEMPAEAKEAYLQELSSLLESTKHLDLKERSSRFNSLELKYGLIQ